MTPETSFNSSIEIQVNVILIFFSFSVLWRLHKFKTCSGDWECENMVRLGTSFCTAATELNLLLLRNIDSSS